MIELTAFPLHRAKKLWKLKDFFIAHESKICYSLKMHTYYFYIPTLLLVLSENDFNYIFFQCTTNGHSLALGMTSTNSFSGSLSDTDNNSFIDILACRMGVWG